MKVRVKLFAVAKELAGCDELSLELPISATIRDLSSAIVIVSPALARIVPHALWAVGAEYAGDDTSLTEQSEVALIPPVSGG
jgi:molybdopterin converting factor small subunit